MTFRVFHADTASGLRDFEQTILRACDGGVLALDIEEDREVHYRPSVALVQASSGGHDGILDPVLLGHDSLAATVEALCLTPRAVIMHGARNDVVGLRRDFGVSPRELRDTQIAARFAGRRAFGLAALLESELGIHIDKAERRSVWIRRPLSPEQKEYAVNDTRHLAPLWSALETEVQAAGWLDAVLEECQALAATADDAPLFDPLGWAEIKGLKHLTEIQRDRVAALWRWRDQIARRENLHASKVLAPWAMEQFAKRGPSYLQELRDLDGIAKPVLRAEREALVELLREPPRAEIPPAKKRSFEVGRELHDARMSRMLQWREQAAESTGLDSGFLAPRQLLEAICRVPEIDHFTISQVPDVRTWRLVRFEDQWVGLLNS